MHKKNNLFFIDFDDTLFDTEQFKKSLLSIFLKNGVSEIQFKNFYPALNLAKPLPYNPYNQIKFLAEQKVTYNKNLLNDLDNLLDDVSIFIFSDTMKFLQDIQKNNYLILISYGDYDFQNKKINSSGLKDLFNEVIITDKIKIEVIANYQQAKKYDQIFLLDDHPYQLDSALEEIGKHPDNEVYKKLQIVRINRGGRKYSNIKTKFQHQEFNDLREIFQKVC